jgi:UDP-glucose 4-epimerase
MDGVFHFAALRLLHCHEYPRTAFDVNVTGTFDVLDACVKHQVQRLVFSSSASVYGDAVHEPMDKDHPFNNKNFYGATKICGEALAHALHHRYGLPHLGLRYMNVYGPRQDMRGAYIAVIMKMLDSIERGESPVIYGDGSEAFDDLAAEDCTRANVSAIWVDAVDHVYKVRAGARSSLNELAEILLNVTGCKVPINFVPRSRVTFVRKRICNPAAKEI